MNKMNLCDDDDRRWKHTHTEIPKCAGKINFINKFDLGFFGLHQNQVNAMDPLIWLVMERAYEAIFDAGMNLEDIRGSKTGVFIGSCFSEAEKEFFVRMIPQQYVLANCFKSMLASRISYALQLTGPSMVCDTACSSSMFALYEAYKAIRDGKCDKALVGGTNLCMNPFLTLQFARLGVLNMGSGCRPFDENADGYTRSEAIVVVLLQKKMHSKRIYAEVVHCKVNADGYTEQGITFPSSADQMMLLKELYEECDVDPSSLAFIEAHGTGTKVGDPEELNAIDKICCAGRKSPLLVGSIKGNIGHTEPVSGLCSLIKVIYAMESGIIPPNIHCDNPKKSIKSLESGRIKIITEKTPWPQNSNLCALNCFGFGGANAHLLLKRPEASKCPLISDDQQPRLICYSGRIAESMQSYMDFFKTSKLDYGVVAMFHNLFKYRILNNGYRGFSLIDSSGELYSSFKYSPNDPMDLHLYLGGTKDYHVNVLKEMEKLTFFANLIDQFKVVLKKNEITDDIYKLGRNAVFATVCLHYCLIETLKSLNIVITSIYCTSLGEFTAAYAAGVLSLKETILSVATVTNIFVEKNTSETDLPRIMVQQLSDVLPVKIAKKTIVQTPKSNIFDYGSAEYFVYNILNPSVLKEYRCDGLILGVDFDVNMIENVQILKMIQQGLKINDILINFGRLYEMGIDGDWSKLYSKVQWPIRRGSPMLSPLIRWKHDKDMKIVLYSKENKHDPEKYINISIINIDLMFYKGHVIDGRTLFPATGYLFQIWEFYASINRLLLENINVCFEEVKFHRATTFGKDGNISLYLVLHKSGYFEVSESNATVVTGRISEVKNTDIVFEGKANDANLPLLKHKDIYKELRLRGYNYRGPFTAIQEICGNNALIEWTGNWITFLDNMLQLFIVQKDTRSLYVPTGLDRLVINGRAHMDQVEDLGAEKQYIPVELASHGMIVRSKNIEIRTMNANAIQRKKLPYSPVLESYKFVANDIDVNMETSLRLNTHIILENKSVNVLKIVERLNENSSSLQPVSKYIQDILGDLPLIQSDIIIKTNMNIDNVKGIEILQEKVEEKNALIYVGSNILGDTKNTRDALTTITDDGYIISIEKTELLHPDNLTILTKHKLPSGEFMYLLKKTEVYQEPICLKVNNDFNSWLPNLQNHLKTGKKVLLYSENDTANGILGLVNCLRREVSQHNLSCVFIQEGNNNFAHTKTFFKKQLEKGMAINVLRGNTWGTYRHVLLSKVGKKDYSKCNHYYAKVLSIGDLSSWSWVEGYYQKDDILNNSNLIEIYYSAINFRDVMIASGKVSADGITKNRLSHECCLGFEYSGKKQNGERVMSFVSGGAISNIIECDPLLTWRIPDQWSLEEAATVPVVYLTVIVAMKLRGKLKRGESVLIHSGTGGVGQAAINYAHHCSCNIFVTVGSMEKKQYLLQHYPFLKESQIGNSRDTTFEQMVFRETDGRGVDLVLNSLAEEKQVASVRCLTVGGRFLEIGKFDLASNNRLTLDLAAKSCTFHGIMLDLMLMAPDSLKTQLYEEFAAGINAGFVKPLSTTVFEKENLEESFRYMSTGKHMGKVLIKIRDETVSRIKNEEENMVLPRFYCDPKGTYIILGGLGGFGLELADWLVLRGAKILVLSSRTGVQTGYQQHRIRIWRSYGVKVVIALEDISTYEGCETLMRNAEAEAPMRAIFNLAVVLKDAMFEKQTVQNFDISMSPKATATGHFDKITRRSKTLKHFVVFSSVSCGRGNPSQTNYGMSNSVMERICESRLKDGFPALAIQWGAVGDVGLVADMQKEQSEIAIGGTLQQRISNCLEVMDQLLYQNEAVVSSMVVAEKSGLGNADNVVDAVLNIIGLRDLKTISLNSTLAELGMDSMMSVEIKQTLERDYDIFMQVQDMRNLTFNKLLELNESKGHINTSNINDSFKLLIDKFLDSTDLESSLIPYKNAMTSDDFVLVFPGIESTCLGMLQVNENIKKPSICLQYSFTTDVIKVEDLVDKLLNDLGEKITKAKTFKFVAHSYGTIVALQMAHRLEKMGKTGKIVLIDGSPELMNNFFELLFKSSNLETTLMLLLMSQFTSPETIIELSESIAAAKDFKERQQIAISALPEDSARIKNVVIRMSQVILNLVKSMETYKVFQGKLKSEIVLCKPTILTVANISADYKLGELSEQPVRIVVLDGDHRTILENGKLHEELNTIF
ncbi:PREDICTED: fatty acid synthase-like [Nicrophorus vespilloides]|uniref:Fatty acid synthase-like n=1 Tax=Nicrophorus vespilloides TaxID=110193 RepID=A0ABM1N8F2_NICVS|nr:PREDICTED: fatty acid synthase-like [Nicrophorus vespilloides]